MKLSYLRIKWGDPSLSLEDLKSYNKFVLSIYYRVVRAELKIEEYLYKNLNAHNWIKSPFSNKIIKSQISKNIKDKIFSHNTMNQSLTIKYIMNEATFGTKIIFWKALKSGLFKDKFKIFKKSTDKTQYTSILENIRNSRNSMAHHESLETWEKKQRTIFKGTNKKNTIKKSLSYLGV